MDDHKRVAYGETVFIFDLDVLQPSYMHFAYDAHTRLEASTLTTPSYVS